ncbi:MAG: hypothetical protein NC187_08320 [Candidatus Amulumruptor caecigallinarius]|nr:hypothetical protein [Candidatus Amulumruptor caecigallinarius]MCM1397474.1 hypothetical protein [Candidatus Amulumruptor caecigallinarius]MCM1454319.1 hypothetical protein [bacterium]
MRKIYGAQERQDGLYLIGRKKWQLIFGFFKDSEDAEFGYNYRETFDHKPSTEEIVKAIKEQVNADVDAKIISGFVWRGMPVWLSTENQFNYKAAYDMAVQTGGASLPRKFKFGTDDKPEYFVFDSLEVFTDFYLKAMAFVDATLSDGWDLKDSVVDADGNLLIPIVE